MQAPLLHGRGTQHAAEKQPVDGIKVLQRDLVNFSRTNQRIGGKRDTAGDPQRDRPGQSTRWP